MWELSKLRAELSGGMKKDHQKRTSESITFRLDAEILKKLREEAVQKDVSINTLVSQTLKQHMEWYSNAAKAGFVSVRKSFLKGLLELISDKDLSYISKKIAENETKDFVLLLRNGFTIENALSALESWFRASGYPFRHETTEFMHSYVIQHDMGRKMSVNLAEIYHYLFESFKLKRVDFDMTDRTLSFIVDTSGSSTT